MSKKKLKKDKGISLAQMLARQREIPGEESQEIQKQLEHLIAYGQQLEVVAKENYTDVDEYTIRRWE